MTKTFDPKVHELAASFLSAEPHLNTDRAKWYLARVIQTAIEDELAVMREEASEYA